MGRLEKYRAKLDSDVLKKRYDDTKELAVRKKAPTIKREVELEEKVKVIIDGEPSFLQHYYMVYGKELVKNSTEREWGITFNKWEARGLIAEILNNISILLVGYNQIEAPPINLCLFDVGRFDVNTFG